MAKKTDQFGKLLSTLGDFTSKENWDEFFKIRSSDEPFEWYAEWAELKDPLISQFSLDEAEALNAQILVPGCGNSRLSEHLYDAGFRGVTNIDFSKVVISDMLRRNVRLRPGMRWRVMDMTKMQFEAETFNVVLDKGGLDALMEPELGPDLGNQYLSEVKRVLKSGGKFICLTLAESHVLGLLFSKFHFGWKMTVHAIPQKPSSKPSLQTFMVVAEKEKSIVLHEITSSFNNSSLGCSGDQARGLFQALQNENQIRREHSSGSDMLCSIEDLSLEARQDLANLSQGRRLQLTLGDQGSSRFSYRAVVLDSQSQFGPFLYHCGVFIVPKTRGREWLFSSEEGQWMVVENSKAARLIMVLLDSSHANASMEDIQKDLSPLVRQLAPKNDDNRAQIPFMTTGDGIKQRNIVHQVTSSLTGPIVVEDVVYENVDGDISRILPSKDLIFRRLVFQRSENLVQSEAILIKEEPVRKTGGGSERKKSKKKGTQRRSDESCNQLKVYHGYLASSYHTGILSGFVLISSYMESVASSNKSVKAVIIGLGAGLLPIFLHGCVPSLHIEVVELDPVILNLARDYFGFTEDEHLQVHIADGIKFIREITGSSPADEVSVVHGDGNSLSDAEQTSINGSCISHEEGRANAKVDIIIIDVDSADSSSGMTCPAADFVEDSFLRTVKENLSDKGLFVINLVARSQAIKDNVVSRMKEVFNHLFCLQGEDVNEVIFGLCSEPSMKEDCFSEASCQLEKLLKFQHPEMRQCVIDAAKKIKRLK
ncbi:methyltransferase-like protein 13 [Morus notabilis]|uniref:methyltransferase-like protein 13 n=1 Tax=Morus notabilis TaxID=981085 RepID=UPI000CED49E0|nr:methyltransferase-like protein 13 [Morus notabilis]